MLKSNVLPPGVIYPAILTLFPGNGTKPTSLQVKGTYNKGVSPSDGGVYVTVLVPNTSPRSNLKVTSVDSVGCLSSSHSQPIENPLVVALQLVAIA